MTAESKFTHTRRRKKQDEVLPTTANEKEGKVKGKKSTKNLLYRNLAWVGLVSLILVIGIFALSTSERAPDHFRKLSSSFGKRQYDSEDDEDSSDMVDDDATSLAMKAHFAGSDNDTGGCFGANVHEIAHQEPNPPGICINDPKLMPTTWRAPDDLFFQDDGSPWTDEEEKLAQEAAEKGLDELIGFFEFADEDRIRALGTDAINSIFDYVIGSGDQRKFHQRALDASIKVLYVSTRYLAGEEAADLATECSKMYRKFKLTGYANRLHQEDPENEKLKKVRDSLVENLNESIQDCGETLDDILENDDETWQDALKDKTRGEDEVYQWAMWAITITECLIVHDLKLPSDSPDFVADVWRYFADYGLPDYRERLDDERGTWVQLAYLATHLQFVPTGYGRHYCYMKDAPYLYHFYRNNFFASFEHGGHDLVAEFIDMLSTYGCTVHNDIQLRHGVRYMLHLYKEAGHSFVKHREEWESRIINDYDRIHKPWTGIASVMTGSTSCFEPEIPGSYGHAFRQTLKVVPVDE